MKIIKSEKGCVLHGTFIRSSQDGDSQEVNDDDRSIGVIISRSSSSLFISYLSKTYPNVHLCVKKY